MLDENAEVVSGKENLGFDHGPQTSDVPLNVLPTMDTEQVANLKLLSDHTKELATHWDAQVGCSIGDPNERTQAFKPDCIFSGK